MSYKQSEQEELFRRAKELFPNESYSAGDIYDISTTNFLWTNDTPMDGYDIIEVFESIDCGEDDCSECDLYDDDHRVLVEFVSERGEDLYTINK